MYKNEDQVGAAIRESGVKRSDVFVVTKLSAEKELHSKEGCVAALRESLKRLGLAFVDLYLIHSPKPGNILDTWRGMLDARRLGLCKAVGVSNFGVKQLEGIAAAGLELPEVNQIEFHVWLQQTACRAYMSKNNIVCMGYCPLARCKRLETLADMAERKGKTAAQIAIRWSLQMKVVTIPKSSKATRISENADVFDWALNGEEMRILGGFDDGFKASGSVNAMDIPWEDVR